MLYITFKKSEKTLIFVDGYFDLNYGDEWLLDPFIQQIIYDVDKSEVLDAGAVKSPVLGIISPTALSGGVKSLILMLKEEREIWATNCGDNCAKWIIEISKLKDITICLSHFMEFPCDFDAFCLDTGTEIHTLNDFRGCEIECLP